MFVVNTFKLIAFKNVQKILTLGYKYAVFI